jgi:hypothetical protein
MLPVFKDFDKSAADILSEDFGLKYTLKTKSATPYGVVNMQNACAFYVFIVSIDYLHCH